MICLIAILLSVLIYAHGMHYFDTHVINSVGVLVSMGRLTLLLCRDHNFNDLCVAQENPDQISQHLSFLLGFLSITRSEILSFFHEIGGSLKVCKHLTLNVISQMMFFPVIDPCRKLECPSWPMLLCMMRESRMFWSSLMIIVVYHYNAYYIRGMLRESMGEFWVHLYITINYSAHYKTIKFMN